MTIGADKDPIDDLSAFTGTPDTPPVAEKRGRGRPRKETSTPSFSNDSAPKSKPFAAKGWTKAAQVEKSLSVSLNAIGLGARLLNEFDGNSIIAGGDDLAHELVALAVLDPRYRRYLEMLSAPGAYGPLLMATGAIVLPIAANHGLFSFKTKTAPATDTLESLLNVDINAG